MSNKGPNEEALNIFFNTFKEIDPHFYFRLSYEGEDKYSLEYFLDSAEILKKIKDDDKQIRKMINKLECICLGTQFIPIKEKNCIGFKLLIDNSLYSKYVYFYYHFNQYLDNLPNISADLLNINLNQVLEISKKYNLNIDTTNIISEFENKINLYKKLGEECKKF